MLPVVVLVDDSKEQLEIHKKLLEDRYSVVCCESGLQAILYIEESVPAVVLLDIEMPHMDGFKTLERIRQTKDRMGIPIIGLTGQNTKSSVLKFIARGGDGYLIKPVKQEKLISTIEKYINHEDMITHDKNILIVDDDLSSLRITQGYLKDLYNVTTMCSGVLAMEYLSKHKPDLIILDYKMSPYTGISLFNMVHKMDGLEDVPIVFVTGVKDKDIIMECTVLQPAGIFLKPVSKLELITKIRDIFSERAAKAEESIPDGWGMF